MSPTSYQAAPPRTHIVAYSSLRGQSRVTAEPYGFRMSFRTDYDPVTRFPAVFTDDRRRERHFNPFPLRKMPFRPLPPAAL